MQFNPLKFVAGKLVRPVLRKLAGETGEQFRKDKDVRRKVALAAVAVARARAEALASSGADKSGPAESSSSVTAWQSVTRGRSIKGRGVR